MYVDYRVLFKKVNIKVVISKEIHLFTHYMSLELLLSFRIRSKLYKDYHQRKVIPPKSPFR